MAKPFNSKMQRLKESVYFLAVLGMLLPGQVFAQCIGVDFTAPTTVACAPAVLNFTAIGVPAGSTFNWKFGTTSISGNDTISYIFTKKGLYTVEMEATIPSMGTCVVTKSAYVNIYMPDTPVLVVDKPKLCNGSDSVQLKNIKPGFSRIDWIIEAQNLQNRGDSLKYLFFIPGAKHIGVKVYDALGCPFLKMFDSAVVVNYTPNISINPSKTQGCKPLITNFSISNNQPSRQIVSYNWQFPGGTPSSSTLASPPNIKYLTSGNYNVILTIKTADSCVYTKTQNFAFYAEDTLKPTFAIYDSVGCAGTQFSFVNTSPKAQFPGSLFWTLSGTSGSDWVLTTDTLNRGKDTMEYNIFNPGLYTVKLEHYLNGCVNNTTKVNSVHAFEVGNSFMSADNISCIVPDSVHLTNTSNITSGKLFKWKLLDNKGGLVDSSSSLNPVFNITKQGNYTVEMTTTIPGKCVDKNTKSNFIKITKPKARFISDTVACAEKEINFSQDVLPYTSDSIHYKWLIWNKDSTDTLKTESDNPFIKYAFNDTGFFDLTFITYSGQCADTLRKDSAIHLIRYKGGIKNTFAKAYCVGVPIGTGPQVLVTPKNRSMMMADWTFTLESNPSVSVSCQGISPGPPPKPDFEAGVAFMIPGRYNARLVLHDGFYNCMDTSYLDTVIKISDVDVKMNVVPGCRPYSEPVTFTPIYNYHYGNASSKINALWKLQIDTFYCKPKDSVNYYYNSTGDTSYMHIFRPQVYDVSVRVTNSDNCSKFYYTQYAIDVMREAIIDVPDSGCKGTSSPITNATYGRHHKYKWITDRPTLQFLPSDTSFAPSLSFTDTGLTRVIFEAYDTLLGCIDRDTDWVYIKSLDINFTTIDTFKKCAPALVNFKVTGPADVIYTWSFGDGDSIATAGTDIYHLYRKNSGTSASDGFTVWLYGVNTLGCQSTLLRTNYIKIQGPVPKFDLLDSIGCEPFQVRFINQSSNLKSFYYDYGDGSPIDSSTMNPNHVYKIKNPSSNQEVFKPKLLAYDNDFCFSIYEDFDSVIVHRKPRAGFTANKRQACQLETILLTDTTALSAKRYWDINNDLVADDSAQTSGFSFLPGFHTVRMHVITTAGCADTLVKPNYILINPSPVINFSVGDTELCFGNPAGLVMSYSSAIPLKSQLWEFGSVTGTEDTSTFKNPYYTFKTPGYKNITLTVYDSNSCEGKLQKNNILLVMDTVINEYPVLQNVTVDLNHAVEVTWKNPVPIRKFDEYRLYRSTPSQPWSKVGAFRKSTDTLWVDFSRLAKDEPVTYRLTQTNRCATESTPSPGFTTIFNQVQSTVHGENQLKWTSFQGYNLSEIRVFGSFVNKQPEYELLAILPANATEFIDKNLCPVEKFYRVKAISATDTNLFSFSNYGNKIPFYEMPVQVPMVRVATVEDNKDVSVSFTNPYTRKGDLIVDRYDTLYGWLTGFETLTGSAPRITDNRVQVDKYIYQYKVKFRDTCGLESDYGNSGANILLKGIVQNDMPNLKWSSYKEWPSGVSHYLVQIWRNGIFETRAKINSDTLFWIDEKIYMDIDTAYIYRIVAVSGDLMDTSISNYKPLTLDSRMWIPSAFTPNGDGVNDLFYPVAVGVYNDSPLDELRFMMQIYNRWGELLFESQNMFVGWDGTFKGVDCPEGVYSYSIKAIGVDNGKMIRKGTVTLIR